MNQSVEMLDAGQRALQLKSMARWTGAAVITVALLTLAAAVIALWSFDSFEQTLAEVDERVVPALAAAFRLSEQTAGLASIAGELADAKDQATLIASTSHLHAVSGLTLNTLSILKADLPVEHARNLSAAVEALTQANEGAGELVAQRLTLTERQRGLAQQINQTLEQFNSVASRLLYTIRPTSPDDGATTQSDIADDIETLLAAKADGSLFLAQGRAALDQTDADTLLNMEISLRQIGVALRNEAGRIAASSLEHRYPDLAPLLVKLLLSGDELVFGRDGVFTLRRRTLAAQEALDAAVADTRQRAADLTGVTHQTVRLVEQEMTLRRLKLQDQLVERRAELLALCLGGLGLALVIAVVIARAVGRHENILREAVAAAEVANQTKSAFLANMSHELRTPLNAVIGFAEILKQQAFGPLGDSRYLQYAGLIESSGDHLLNIIGDILDISKIEAGKVELRPQPTAPAAAVDAVLRLVEGRAAKALVQITVVIDDNAPTVYVDPVRLKQILLNLLSNALKFTAPQGRIRIRVGAAPAASPFDPPMARFEVSDNGIGMSPEGLAKALQPFGQVDTPENHKHGGAGLGLPLVVKLVELSGGKFRISSAPGRGATIAFTLPASSSEPATSRAM